jgi:hypothetical protein
MKSSRSLSLVAVPTNPSLHLVPSTNSYHLDRRAFGFDRHLVVRSIEVLTTEVERAAIDLELAAAANGLEASIAKQLQKEGCELRLTLSELKKLCTSVVRPRIS